MENNTNENNNVNVNEATEDYREAEEETVEAEKKERPKSFFGKVKDVMTSKPVKIVVGSVIAAGTVYGVYKGVKYIKHAKAISNTAKHAEKAVKKIVTDNATQIDLPKETVEAIPTTAPADIPIDVPKETVNNVVADVAKTVEETVAE